MTTEIYQQNVILPTQVANYNNNSTSTETVSFSQIETLAVPYEVIVATTKI